MFFWYVHHASNHRKKVSNLRTGTNPYLVILMTSSNQYIPINGYYAYKCTVGPTHPHTYIIIIFYNDISICGFHKASTNHFHITSGYIFVISNLINLPLRCFFQIKCAPHLRWTSIQTITKGNWSFDFSLGCPFIAGYWRDCQNPGTGSSVQQCLGMLASEHMSGHSSLTFRARPRQGTKSLHWRFTYVYGYCYFMINCICIYYVMLLLNTGLFYN